MKNVRKIFEKAKENKELKSNLFYVYEKLKKDNIGKDEFVKLINEKVLPIARKENIEIKAEDFLHYNNLTKLDEKDLRNIAGGVSPKVIALSLFSTMLLSSGLNASASDFSTLIGYEDSESIDGTQGIYEDSEPIYGTREIYEDSDEEIAISRRGNFYRNTNDYEDNLNLDVNQLENMLTSNWGESVTLNSNDELMRFKDWKDKGKVKSITIGSDISKIPSRTFENCTNLSSIKLPETLKEIGLCAFLNCKFLKEITLPASLRKMDRNVFDNCTALEKVHFPKDSQLKDLGKASGKFSGGTTFYGCTSLKEIDIPSSVVEITDLTFWNCMALEKINISPDSKLTKIGSRAFEGCSALKKITIPAGCSFEYGIKPNNLKINTFETGNDTLVINNDNELNFENRLPDLNIKKIVVSEGVTRIPDKFSSKFPNLEEIKFPSSLKEIGMLSFINSNNLKRVEFNKDSKLRSIEKMAFAFCGNLEEFEMPKDVTDIGEWAFVKCTSLSKINIPNKILNIGKGAFLDCYKLSTIKFDRNCRLEKIGGDAFANCKNLRFFTVPSTVKEIGTAAFKGCSSLSNLKFGENPQLKTIRSSAFVGCKIKKVLVPKECNYLENSFDKNTAVIK